MILHGSNARQEQRQCQFPQTGSSFGENQKKYRNFSLMISGHLNCKIILKTEWIGNFRHQLELNTVMESQVGYSKASRASGALAA